MDFRIYSNLFESNPISKAVSLERGPLQYVCVYRMCLTRFRRGWDAQHIYMIAFLSDDNCLSCLRATVTADGLKYRFPYVTIIHFGARYHTVTGAYAVGLASHPQYHIAVSTSYRGTQPHSTESTMNVNVWIQATSVSVRQYQSVQSIII